MNRKFIHYVLVSVSNIAIKAFMVSLTALTAFAWVSLVFHLVTKGISPTASFGILG